MTANFFINPRHPMQRKYEALRASYLENLTDSEVAAKFGYSFFGYKTIKRDSKKIEAEHFFHPIRKGRPAGLSSKTTSMRERIIELRKKNLSIVEIREKLEKEGVEISDTPIAQVLSEEGFAKLFRRTYHERLEALQADKKYPDVSNIALFGQSSKFSTSYGGIFLFLPLIIQLDLPELFNTHGLYGSKVIPRINYMLSYLALKLLGKERLCHMNDLSFDYGLGTFAGLNVMPKSTAISSYSYRHTPSLIRTLLKGFCKTLHKNEYIKGQNINLDFHSIPFFGEEPSIENHWVPTRGKSMKSILSFFAQDLDTTFLVFSDGDIKNKEANDEILEFVKFYKSSIGLYPECLIFDSKLTSYENLYKLHKMGIKFITLARRGKNFASQIQAISQWKGIKLEGATREYKNLKYFQQPAKLRDYPENLSEIIVTGNGRELPMRLITNDLLAKEKDTVQKYARRWRIENNIQENIDFFSLNALSSSVVVQVDFDIAMTLIANTLYKIIAQKTKWMNKAKPKTVARNIIDTKADVIFNQNEVIIKFANRTYNPIIKEWVDSLENICIPWWNNKKLICTFFFTE